MSVCASTGGAASRRRRRDAGDTPHAPSPSGDCTLSHIARFLSLSVRALQNRLDAEHSSFQLLLDKVRRELATKHLSQGDMQLTQLAYLLGYSELSAFSRSFKRWYGTSPRNWQRLQLSR